MAVNWNISSLVQREKTNKKGRIKIYYLEFWY